MLLNAEPRRSGIVALLALGHALVLLLDVVLHDAHALGLKAALVAHNLLPLRCLLLSLLFKKGM